MDIFFYIALGILAIIGWEIGKKLTTKPDGEFKISKQDASQIFRLQVDIEPEEMAKRKHVLFKVVRVSPNEED